MGNGSRGEADPIFGYLLDCGADPNLRDSLGLTPLHIAVAAFCSSMRVSWDNSQVCTFVCTARCQGGAAEAALEACQCAASN